MRKRIALEVEGDLDALRIVWGMMEEMLQYLPPGRVREEEKYATMVAVQEIVTNVLRHAHKGDPNKPLRVEFETDQEALTITTIDQGPPFDPGEELRLPDEENPAEGGYGIFIMRSVMSSFEYERQGGANILTMVKDFGRQAVLSGTGDQH